MSEMTSQNRGFSAGLLGIVLAVAMATMGACAATPTRESTGGYIDDSAITAKVKSDLAQDPNTSAMAVHVITYKGVVDLNGFANSPQEITEAGRVAHQVSGVRSVHNNLVLKEKAAPPTTAERRIQ